MGKQVETETIPSSNYFPVVGIGASAGGLDAFKRLIRNISVDSGMAYVLVQHLHPDHESALPELLQKVAQIPVQEISNDIHVEPDHIYIIPSNKMLRANDGVLLLKQRPVKNTNGLNLPVDVFFTSLAEVHREQAIGVILSGSASDGTRGLKAIKDAGGITFAQDESSAAFYGMPGSAIQAGVVDFVMPPENIPQKLLEIKASFHRSDEAIINAPAQEREIFKQILSLLRIRKGTDFTYYKQTTVRRRILRRIAIKRQEDPAEYVQYLRDNPLEQDALYQDLLIPVTAFFRDAKVFSSLCESVFPHLLKQGENTRPTRIWIAGCSTGEEAYSMAICLKEYLGERMNKIQIFATDISEPAIAKARSGLYSTKELEGVSNERLNEYFTKIDRHFQLSKEIRGMCIFAVHNFLKDPPFGRLDLVSCRNVLIYMEPYLQKKALTTFHYSLNDKGFVLLGKSETASSVPDLFSSADKNNKLFYRKDVAGRIIHLAKTRKENVSENMDLISTNENSNMDFQKSAEEVLLNRYTPPGVIVNDEMEIVLFRGNTSEFLGQSTGKPSHNLLKMAKGGLAFELRNLVHKAKKESTTITKDDIIIQGSENQRVMSIVVIPLVKIAEPHYLVLFRESSRAGIPAQGVMKSKGGQTVDERDLHIKKLEREIVETHESMRSITEEQEAANEELQSANEELLSGSEELQSLNEELESSKEELQSTNEELMVLNQELVSLNEQVTLNANYTQSIVATISQPLLVLDKNLRVRSANRAFYNTFQVVEENTEGALIYDLGGRQWNIPKLRELLENILPTKSSITAFEVEHEFPSIGNRIILLSAVEINLVKETEKMILIVFDDVTGRRKAEKEELNAKKRLQFIANAMPQKVWTADREGNTEYFNKAWMDYSGLGLDDLQGWKWIKLIHPDELESTKERWLLSIKTGNIFEMEHRLRDVQGTYKWHLSRALSQHDEFGILTMWIGTNTEIEAQKKQEHKLQATVADRTMDLAMVNESLQRKNEELSRLNHELESFTYIASHDLQEPLRKIQTFAKLILDTESGEFSDTARNYFNRMSKAAKRMQTLIEDLLDYSHTSIANRKFEKVDLNKLIKQIKQELAEVIADRHAVIETNELCEVYINESQFRQVFSNLLGNSLKFSRPGIPPIVRIHSEIIENSETVKKTFIQRGLHFDPKQYCHIRISDNGIGFEPQFEEQIFEVFQRLHGKEQYAGTGIGLAIVKKIIENHSGFVTAKGVLGNGAQFDIYIPL